MIASGSGRVTYTFMAIIAPEYLWGLLFGLHSVMSMYSLLSGERSYTTLILDGLLGCLLWTTSTIACFAAHWPQAPGLNFLDTLLNYPPPAAMSADIVMAGYAWWHMIKFWAEE